MTENIFMNVAEELKKARAGKYAIGAFNTSNLEVTKAICKAASEFDTPILVATTPSAIEYAGLQSIFDIVRDEIASSNITASIHLDHGKDFELIKETISIGYKSVMFDGSKLSFEENAHLTERLVEFAHRHGASVEAEVGVIGHEEGGHVSGHSTLSAPAEVKRFVDLTGVDSIAVAIGNEHGAPKGEKLNIELLREIAENIDIPLVLHGASGLSEGDLREAISAGVAKINIDTNIRKAFLEEIQHSHEEGDYRIPLAEGMEEVEKVVSRYLKIFNAKLK